MNASSLVPNLKRLRLSGILDTLEVRTQQAIAERWSYEEFLVRLIHDEVERRGHKQLELCIRRGGSTRPRRWRASTSPSTPQSRTAH